jgi:hypothetical protein
METINLAGLDIFYLTMAIVGLTVVLLALPTLIKRSSEGRKQNE